MVSPLVKYSDLVSTTRVTLQEERRRTATLVVRRKEIANVAFIVASFLSSVFHTPWQGRNRRGFGTWFET